MTQDEIIELARQAGVRDDEHIFEFSQYKYLEAFARLVAEKERERMTVVATDAAGKAIDVALKLEREACANICETLELPDWPDKVRQPLAQAIRARGQS
jgi:hypothetical protein